MRWPMSRMRAWNTTVKSVATSSSLWVDVRLLLAAIAVLVGIACGAAPPGDSDAEPTRQFMREVEEQWQHYLEGTAAEAEKAMEKAVARCEEALREGDVPRFTVDAVLHVSYARLMCTRLALGKQTEAMVAYNLARCAFLHREIADPDANVKAGILLEALESTSPAKEGWLVLALDMNGRNGRLPRYVEEHCDVFRDVLEAHGVSCPGEGSEESPGKAGGNEAGTGRKKGE